MNLRNPIGKFREAKFFERSYKMPTVIIKITIVLYAIIGLVAVGITLKNEGTKTLGEFTSARTFVIISEVETKVTTGLEERNSTITAVTCYDYAEVYAEKYQVNTDLLKKIIEAFPEDYKTAIAIAMAESRLVVSEIGDKQMAKWSYGLFQINRTWHDYTPAQLLDEDFNIKIAREIYEKNGWERWSTYKSGKYIEYL